MEIYLGNVNFSIRDGKQYHGLLRPYIENIARSQDKPIPRYHVFLYPDKRFGSRPHSGSGSLTLVDVAFAEAFLAMAASPAGVTVGGRRLRCERSRREPQAEQLNKLRRTNTNIPSPRHTIASPDHVAIRAIQAGYRCRDGVVSVEWETEAPIDQSYNLRFDAEKRQIQVTIPETGTAATSPIPTNSTNNSLGLGSELFYQPFGTASTSGALVIGLKYSNIEDASAHEYRLDREHVIVFQLDTPPTFLREHVSFDDVTYERLACLPIKDHEKTVQFTSHVVRLVCHDARELEKFRTLARRSLHRLRSREVQMERRGLFATTDRDILSAQLASLPWTITFQIESILHNKQADFREMILLIRFIRIMNREHGTLDTAAFLRFFARHLHAFNRDYINKGDWSQTEIVGCFREAEQQYRAMRPRVVTPDPALFESLHVGITPTTMHMDGPHPEQSNRVIRSFPPEYHQYFLRVSFVDEARLQYRFDRDVDGPGFIRKRVGKVLLEGLDIAGRRFEFLAYSQSALKQHAVWFVLPFQYEVDGVSRLVTAESIIQGLGRFDAVASDPMLMYCPARYGARVSQAFTATYPTTVEVEEIIVDFPDISTSDKKYHFTDGVGTISPELVRAIQRDRMRMRRVRRIRHLACIQIRFMGSKGMLSVDYRLKGSVVCLRPSMVKFETPQSQLIEIARVFDRPTPYYLNRPLIMLLEGLGVPYDVFSRFQDLAVQTVHESTETCAGAATMLEQHGLGSSFRLSSVLLGLKRLNLDHIEGDSFYRDMMLFAVHHVLRDLKHHARIPIPGAYTLVGVADEHNFLREGEIFACIKPIDSNREIYLEGDILISRSPTIHPGDAQIVRAIGRPPPGTCFDSEPLANTVVFSVKGSRPLPSFLGGGDLDGDVYNLIPLASVGLSDFRPRETREPADYSPPRRKTLNRVCTMKDVGEFVVEYINADILGLVAINWLKTADANNIFHGDCLRLAQLHSNAVDYPKSGQPVTLAELPRIAREAKRPDWNAPETVVDLDPALYYESTKAIGRLFRAIDLDEAPTARRRSGRTQEPDYEDATSALVDDLAAQFEDLLSMDDPICRAVEDRVVRFIPEIHESPAPEDDRSTVADTFSRYSAELRGICTDHTLSRSQYAMLSEAEVVIGTIAQKTSQPRLRKDLMSKMRERTEILVREVREDLFGDEDEDLERTLERAWLAWQVSLLKRQQERTDKREILGASSFGWIALGAIFDTIKNIEERNDSEMRNRYG